MPAPNHYLLIMQRVSLLALVVLGLLLFASSTAVAQSDEEVVRVGIIGLDTSHSTAFAEILNDPEADSDVAGFRVVAAYPYGSREIESSYSRIPQYTEDIKAMGIEVVDSIGALLRQVDMVLLETNDGRLHLEQALEVFEAGKPVFIDKPMAASLADVIAMFEAAEHYGVPVFSSSSLRYMPGAQLIRDGAIGQVVGAETYSPARLEETHPDLFWYGVHGVEALFTVMGTGCEEVVRVRTDSTDLVVGQWADGRIGTFRGLRAGDLGYGGTAFGSEDIAPIGPYEGYRPLVVQIAEFFRTGEAPVSPEETIEIFAFMEAAHESTRRGGVPVRLEEVLQQARTEAKQRWTASR